MVKQRSPDDSVDLFHSESFRELAQRKHCNGQVLDGPVADGELFNPPVLNLSVLTARKGALYRPELWDAKLLGEVGVERDL